MEIRYGTAEELRKMREEEFLALDGHERLMRFLQMIQESAKLHGDKRNPKDSFVIKRRDDS